MALTQVKTSGIADDAVTLAKQAGGTDGQIITYDASGNPTAVGPGSDGQVLTSTGAGSPPAFENLPTSGATLSGSTDNTIVTVTGSNAMQGEANLKYDGSTLTIADVDADNVIELGYGSTGNNNAYIDFVGDTTYTDYGLRLIRHDSGANSAASLVNRGTGALQINAQDAGTVELMQNNAVRLELETDGDVKVNTGNLVIGTSGKGIDFSATASPGATGSSDSSELLDDYEEGSWTPVLYYYDGGWQTSNVTTAGGTEAYYVKSGRVVHFYLKKTNFEHDSGGDHYAKLGGLPYSTNQQGGAVVTYSQAFTANNEDATALLSGGALEFYRGTSWLLWSTSSNRQLYLYGTYQANA